MKRFAPWFLLIVTLWSGCGKPQSPSAPTAEPHSSATAQHPAVVQTESRPQQHMAASPSREVTTPDKHASSPAVAKPAKASPPAEAHSPPKAASIPPAASRTASTALVPHETAPALAAAQTEVKPATASSRVNQPAVAGQFYPADKVDLSRTLDKLLSSAQTVELKNLRAIICPHAGYEFSGRTAAAAYKQLIGRDIRTAIVLGPSHRGNFSGAALPNADFMATPLGQVVVAPWVANLAQSDPFVIDPECEISLNDQRVVHGHPFAYEHSVETQIPFLQRVAPQAQIVPIVLGRVDPLEVARALDPHLDEHTLIVASTDLSHYLPEAIGRPKDAATVRAICRLEGPIDPNQACGFMPIEAVMYLARQHHWTAQVLAEGNSNDVTHEKAGVGYVAIAFVEREGSAPAAASPPAPHYSAADRKFLLELARKTVAAVVAGKKPPEVKKGEAAAHLFEKRGCFVTLKEDDNLRGCIGSIQPQEPLIDAVIHMAQAAALYDRRFPPVQPRELGQIEIEISVLTVPKALEFSSTSELFAQLRPNIDGVVFSYEGSQSTYLPQVWEQLPSKDSFLSHLAEKAGMSPFAWHSDKAHFETYQVEAFKEGEQSGEAEK